MVMMGCEVKEGVKVPRWLEGVAVAVATKVGGCVIFSRSLLARTAYRMCGVVVHHVAWRGNRVGAGYS